MKVSSVRNMSALALGLTMACSSCSTEGSVSAQPSLSENLSQTSQATSLPTATSTANVEDCPLSPEEVKQAMGAIVGSGVIVIDQEYTGGGKCTYNLPTGSLAEPGTGGTVFRGTDGASLTIHIYAYSENYKGSTGVYNVEREWGGSTAQQVIESKFIADRDTTTAQLGEKAGAAVRIVQDIGAGAVSNGAGQFTVAGLGEYWYDGGVSGVKGSPAYEEGILNVARALVAGD
jgi:hypothetical protein